MTDTERELNQRLEQLEAEGTTAYQSFTRSNDEILHLLVKAFLWYLDASAVAGYIERLCEERNITWRRGNDINFTPVLRLVFGLIKVSRSVRVTLSFGNKACHALYAEFERDPGYYASNPEGKLFDFAKNAGGVSGLAHPEDLKPDIEIKAPPKPEPPDPDNPGPTDPDEPVPLPEDETPIVESISDHPSSFDNEHMKVSEDGLALLLIRPEEGSFSPVGSSDDRELIKMFAGELARRDRLNLSDKVRPIVYAVETQARPQASLPTAATDRLKWLRQDYGLDKATIKVEQRVTLIRQDTIIVTRSGNSPSVVTHGRLRKPAFPAEPLLLAPEDAIRIEELVGTGEIAWLRDDGDGIAPAPSDSHTYELCCRNIAKDRPEFFRFSKAAGAAVIWFKHEAFQAAWRSRVDYHWARRLGDWAAEWFAGLGKHNHIGRSNHALMELDISEHKWTVRFNRLTASAEFPVATEVLESIGPIKFYSADLAPVLYRLGQARPATGIIISGNRHALMFEYETAIGSFLVALPTYDEGNRRADPTLFESATG